MALLGLIDTFAEGRGFFDDDPLAELAKRGLDVDDFTVVTPGTRIPSWDTCSTSGRSPATT